MRAWHWLSSRKAAELKDFSKLGKFRLLTTAKIEAKSLRRKGFGSEILKKHGRYVIYYKRLCTNCYGKGCELCEGTGYASSEKRIGE